MWCFLECLLVLGPTSMKHSYSEIIQSIPGTSEMIVTFMWLQSPDITPSREKHSVMCPINLQCQSHCINRYTYTVSAHDWKIAPVLLPLLKSQLLFVCWPKWWQNVAVNIHIVVGKVNDIPPYVHFIWIFRIRWVNNEAGKLKVASLAGFLT